MAVSSKHFVRARISRAKFRQLLKLFALDLTAVQITALNGQDELVRGTAHINGIEGFCGLAKTRLVKFKGMSRLTYYLHLKECEFRFNHRDEDLYQLLLKITRSVIAI
jgi:transposase-like protein